MSPTAIPLAVGLLSWAAAWLAWTAGAVRMADSAWPGDPVGAAMLAGAAVATAGLLVLDSTGRRGPWRPLAFAATLTPLVVLDPGLAATPGRFVLLAGTALLTLGYFVLALRLRIRAAAAAGVAADAAEIGRFAYPRYAGVLAAAAVGSFLLLSAPQWAADAVSARWAVSLDATSTPIIAGIALATTFLVGAVTYLRFAWTPATQKPSEERTSGRGTAHDSPAAESEQPTA